MTNTRTLKSRNQREGWYAGLKVTMRSHSRLYILKYRANERIKQQEFPRIVTTCGSVHEEMQERWNLAKACIRLPVATYMLNRKEKP